MSTHDWWDLKSEVQDELNARELAPTAELVDRVLVAARDRAVAQAGSWWPGDPAGLVRVARSQLKAASAALSTDQKLAFVDQAIAAVVHRWANERIRSSAPGLLERLVEACAEIGRSAGLDETNQRSLQRAAKRHLRARLTKLDLHLTPDAEVSPAELDRELDAAADHVGRQFLRQVTMRRDVAELAASYPETTVTAVTEIVEHAGFDPDRFDGGVSEIFDREYRRGRAHRGFVFDDAIGAELDSLYEVLRSEEITDRTDRKVATFGRSRGRRLDRPAITAYLLDKAERSVERTWTFRDKLNLGPKELDNPEAYGWRVVSQHLTTWLAEYSAIAPPLSPLIEAELENVPGETPDPPDDVWFEATVRIADRAGCLLDRAGIELAGVIDDQRAAKPHARQRTALWELFHLAVIVKRLEHELIDPTLDSARRPGPRQQSPTPEPHTLRGLVTLRAIVDDPDGRELKLLVHNARCLLDVEWRSRYPDPSKLPDSDSPDEQSDYQTIRRRTIGQDTSPHPIISGGVARLLSGLHHDIAHVFAEETPQ